MQEVFPKLKDVNASMGRVCFWTSEEEVTLRMMSFLIQPVTVRGQTSTSLGLCCWWGIAAGQMPQSTKHSVDFSGLTSTLCTMCFYECNENSTLVADDSSDASQLPLTEVEYILGTVMNVQQSGEAVLIPTLRQQCCLHFMGKEMEAQRFLCLSIWDEIGLINANSS